MSAGKAAFRIAWRDARKARGRTALVAFMIGLPVMMITAVAVLLPTAQWSAREQMPYDLGRADARISGGGTRAPIEQTAEGEVFVGGDGPVARSGPDPGKPWTTEEVQRLVQGRFGPTARVVPVVEGAATPVRTPRGALNALVTETDLRDPLLKGVLDITEGRAAATPDEIALGAVFAERGFKVGDTAEVDLKGTRKRVVGFVRSPQKPKRPILVAGPGAFPARADTSPEWLVGAGKPVTWSDVRAFNGSGLLVTSRAVLLDPPASAPVNGGGEEDAAMVAIIALVVAMIVLEVVLLAGPAFAVGLRRQRRSLALMAAAGGDARHLRTVVLAGGLVIGGGAALGGAAAGIGLAAIAAALSGNWMSEPFGPLEVPWAQVAVTVVLGAGSGLAAALVPSAQAARMNVVAALAGRRDEARVRKGWPIVGGVLVVGGMVMSLVGSRTMKEFGAAIGAVAIVVGCVLVAPGLVALAGRTARVLPLPLRLAVRDGARNRGRAAPAVAAIMAAVAGITTLAIAMSSDFEQQRVEYRAELPMGTAQTRLGPGQEGMVRQAMQRELPGVPLVTLRSMPSRDESCPGSRPGMPDDCPMVDFEIPGDKGEAMVFANVVGGPREARYLLGRDVPEVGAALAAGRAVVFGAGERKVTKVTAKVFKMKPGEAGEQTLRTVRDIPAVTAPGDPHIRVLVPPAVAARVGLPTSAARLGVDPHDHRVTEAEQARLSERLTPLLVTNEGEQFDVIYVERGFTASNLVPLLILGVAGAVLALGASLITTRLSAADSRPDLATLAAIGARPRTRRLLMMGQAGFIAVLGCWLGIAAGIVPGVAAAYPLTSPTNGGDRSHGTIVEIPWAVIGLIGVLVPLVAVLAAGLFTRSRLPVVRRLAG